MNQFNEFHDDGSTEPPIEWNIQPPTDHFKFITTPPKTSPAVSDNMWRLNHRAIDNGDVEVHP